MSTRFMTLAAAFLAVAGLLGQGALAQQPAAPKAKAKEAAPKAPQPKAAPPATRQPEARKPEVRKPEARRPEARKPANPPAAKEAPREVRKPVTPPADKDDRDTAKDARETAKDRAQDARDTAKDRAKDAKDDARDTAKDTRDAADRAKDKDKKDVAKDRAQDAKEDAKDSAKDTAKDDRRDAKTAKQNRKFDAEKVQANDLGVELKEADEGLAISNVQRGSVFADTGLRSGDRIVSVGGRDVVRQRDFISYLFGRRASGRVPIIVMRGGARETIYVQPATIIRHYETVVVDDRRDPIRDFGIVLDDGYDDRLYVDRVIKDSAADHAGVRADDEILAVNERDVQTPRDLARLLDKFEGERIDMEVRRDRQAKVIEVEEVILVR